MKEVLKTVGGWALSYAPKSLQTSVKEKVELLFWQRTLKKHQGVFYNGHMMENFTTLFGLTKDDYAGKRVLDIGCGPIGTLEWCDTASERVGVDPLASRYSEMNAGRHAMRYVEAGAESIPFADGYFDIVSLFNSLDHVENVPSAVREAQRVLSPGGTLLLIVEVGHPATLTEPHSMDEGIVDLFAEECDEISRRVFGVRDDHDLYGSIHDGLPRKDPSDPAILAVRFKKRMGS